MEVRKKRRGWLWALILGAMLVLGISAASVFAEDSCGCGSSTDISCETACEGDSCGTACTADKADGEAATDDCCATEEKTVDKDADTCGCGSASDDEECTAGCCGSAANSIVSNPAMLNTMSRSVVQMVVNTLIAGANTAAL